jgi:hypothetical protein
MITCIQLAIPMAVFFKQNGKTEESKLSHTIDGTGHIVIQELEDERAIWIALTRQIILDCQYLDSGTESCRPPECDPSLPHADGVAESVLGILDAHFDKAFDKRILSLKVGNVFCVVVIKCGVVMLTWSYV